MVKWVPSASGAASSNQPPVQQGEKKKKKKKKKHEKSASKRVRDRIKMNKAAVEEGTNCKAEFLLARDRFYRSGGKAKRAKRQVLKQQRKSPLLGLFAKKVGGWKIFRGKRGSVKSL